MLFNSYEFIFIFLPVVMLVFFTLSKLKLTKLATASLVIASLLFYAYWNIRYVPLLLASIVFNFNIGRALEKAHSTSGRIKPIFILGVAVDLLLLGYFKYTNFFIGSINTTFDTSLAMAKIVLPLGISFFTFTQLSYLVDSYRRKTEHYDLLTYALFVTFFPHLIAGPILYHKNVIPQFHSLRSFVFSHKNLALGVTMFTLGLFKKVVIADKLSTWVNPVFSQATSVSFLEVWAGALAYALQLYFDFSGYSDMAIGLGLMFNIRLPINFNSPYKSTSIIEFWRRWHITLSNFLRDYLYIPLGGNRLGHFRRMLNLMVTMLLGGLWHGAGWTFVVWGGLHGLYLVINHSWRKLSITLPKISTTRFLSWSITFIAVVAAWVVFRANSVGDAVAMLKTMTGIRGVVLPMTLADNLEVLGNLGIRFGHLKAIQEGIVELALIAVLMLAVISMPNTNQILQRFQPRWYWAITVVVIAVISISKLNQVSEFLYFQF